jgi:hypothetical protein
MWSDLSASFREKMAATRLQNSSDHDDNFAIYLLPVAIPVMIFSVVYKQLPLLLFAVFGLMVSCGVLQSNPIAVVNELLYPMRLLGVFVSVAGEIPSKIIVSLMRRYAGDYLKRLALGLDGFPFELIRPRQTPMCVRSKQMSFREIDEEIVLSVVARRDLQLASALGRAVSETSGQVLRYEELLKTLNETSASVELVHSVYFRDDKIIDEIADAATKNSQSEEFVLKFVPCRLRVHSLVNRLLEAETWSNRAPQRSPALQTAVDRREY